MKPGKSVLAMTGTVVMLSLSVVVHTTGQLGGGNVWVLRRHPGLNNSHAEAIALQPANFEAFAVPGKEADAIYGDVVLRNGYLSAVIAQPLANRHANMTVKDVAGALIDLSVRTAYGGDQLAAFYPGRKTFPFRSISLRDPDGNQISPNESGAFGKVASVVVKAEGTDERPELVVTYELQQGSEFITIISVFTKRASKPLTVVLEDDFRADGGKEDMPRSPNGTADRFWLYDRYWGQAYGLDADGYKLQLTSDSRVTTIKYENPAGETSVEIPPEMTIVFKRRLYPCATIFDVQALAGKPSDAIDVEFFAEKFPAEFDNLALEVSQRESVLGMVRFEKSSKLFTRLPAGDYTARLYLCGNPLPAGEEFQVLPGRNRITLKMDAPRGNIIGEITDSDGAEIPCKIEFKPLEEGAKLNFGPETGEFALRNLVYSPNGKFHQTVPAGRYAITISHGPEYDVVQSEIDVTAGSIVPVEAKLVRSVATPGWVSGDFHSHSTEG